MSGHVCEVTQGDIIRVALLTVLVTALLLLVIDKNSKHIRALEDRITTLESNP